ncbi:M23 family metallopeptidase [uncultured Croceicoccus sp.]|uniref:M23 family metallopeptidase n=1 Tax=uncultured Croceicoccus sp. TaxID=1295329 RepID=UPI00262ED077|nr:M23 family metallopeptidase [uncultured Croceicoccus sp.]
MNTVRDNAGRFARDVKIAVISIALTSIAWLLAYALLDPYRPPEPNYDPSVGDAPLPTFGDASDAARVQDRAGGGEQAVPRAADARGNSPARVRLAIPVAGVRADMLTDTFRDARAGGKRVHDAIDIMAPAGTPVLAAEAGVVEKLFRSDEGGETIYIRTPDGGEIHYYAHLRRYAPQLREGARIRRGDRLGTVGSTGNADPSAPHLHFAVMRMEPGEEWFEGSAINPYPLLTGRR